VSTFGAASSVVLVLLWVYYASLILFYGAEFTRVYAEEHGVAIQPTEYAIKTDLTPAIAATPNLQTAEVGIQFGQASGGVRA
jgi:uncharacterized BrkB/YihY/UPF0761 family membrane protein